MPWDCRGCETRSVADDVACCPGCGTAKMAWSVVADKTRAFQVTGRDRLRALRGVGDAPVSGLDGVEWEPAEDVVALPAGFVTTLVEQGKGPAPAHVLAVRLPPAAPGEAPCVAVVPALAARPSEERVLPTASLPTGPEARLLFVFGCRGEPPVVPGLAVIDVSDDVDLGCAASVALGAAGKKRRTSLPVRAVRPPIRVRLHGAAGHRVYEGVTMSGAGEVSAGALARLKALKDEYDVKELASVWDIRQDLLDSDCGPTCAMFLRYGGALAVGTPLDATHYDQEMQAINRIPLVGAFVDRMATREREETAAADGHDKGTVPAELEEILDGFAGPWAGQRQGWSLQAAVHDLSAAPGEATLPARLELPLGGGGVEVRRATWSRSAFAAAARALGERLRKLTRSSPRGVAVPFWSTVGLPIAEGAKTANGGGNHWVVCTGIDGADVGTHACFEDGHASPGAVSFYDPLPGSGGRRTLCLYQFAYAHLLVSQKTTFKQQADEDTSASPEVLLARSTKAVSSSLLAAFALGDPVEDGTFVCELDAGNPTWNRLHATAPAEWFSSCDEADARALELACKAERCTAVVEWPRGCFGVIATDCKDVWAWNAAGPVDRADSQGSLLVKGEALRVKAHGRDGLASLALFLRSGSHVHYSLPVFEDGPSIREAPVRETYEAL